jgi:hypothetical protein
MKVFKVDDDSFWDQAPPDLRYALLGARAMKQDLAIHLFGDPDETGPTTIEFLRMPAGYVLPRHSHRTHRFEIVISGSVSIADQTLRSGDAFVTAPGEEYGPLTTGPEGCLSVELFSSPAGVDANFNMDTVDEERMALLVAAGEAAGMALSEFSDAAASRPAE